jgi:hypothetical protein
MSATLQAAPEITEGGYAPKIRPGQRCLEGLRPGDAYEQGGAASLCDIPFSSYVLASNLLLGADEKPSRGMGQSPILSAHCAAGSSSLDGLSNNRNTIPVFYRRPSSRGTWCGRKSIVGVNEKGQRVYRRVNCGCWHCSYCGPRRARTARYNIQRCAEGLQLRYFLTLTLDPKKLSPSARFAGSVRYMRGVWAKFRVYLRRKYGESPNFICVLEFHENGRPHLHILTDRYMPQAWVSATWSKLGGGRIVDIRRVTIKNVARYVSKYFTKQVLLSAPKGARRITSCRAIKLFPKFASDISWEFLHESIWQMLAMERARLHVALASQERQKNIFRTDPVRDDIGENLRVDYDEESFLKGFTIQLSEVGNVT